MNEISFGKKLGKVSSKLRKPIISTDTKFREISPGFVKLCDELSLDQVLKILFKSSKIRSKVRYVHARFD